jgi:hypothetical protein
MTHEEQLQKWLEGDSIHNAEFDECTPDFSCCTPETQAPLEERELFVNAYRSKDDQTVGRMLGMFLGRAIKRAFPEKDIHIVAK